MLDPPRYLLGVAEIFLLGGFAWLGGSALRLRLLPAFNGAPAHLAGAVLALALLVWTAEILGAFAWFDAGAYLVGVAAVGVGLRLCLGGGRGGPPRPPPRGRSPGTVEWGVVLGLAIAATAVFHFVGDLRPKLSTGMTGFDSTWYHGPFAAGFFQSGDTWGLHLIAPQFLAWFYPANAELFHAVGMLAFGRDLLSPWLNLGWFAGCLLALWCIGRPYRVAPWSLALGAIALSLPVLSDQAGEARNDIVGIFFLLAAAAVALNASGRGDRGSAGEAEEAGEGVGAKELSVGALLVTGLAAGLAAGTKLNFLLPAAVLVAGLAVVAPAGSRWRALWLSGLAAVAGGGYWYLRNLVHTGNPLPWFDRVGPISLPAPEQALGGREGHSALGYLTDGGVWSDWFLPGLHHGLTILWPLLGALALTGLLLALAPLRVAISRPPGAAKQRMHRGGDMALSVAAFAGIAAALAWLIAPTSASGPDGIPRGFESGLRYLAPALVIGLALLPVGLKLLPIVPRRRLRGADVRHPPNGRMLESPASLGRRLSGRGMPDGRALAFALAAAAAIAIGYPIQRHYLQNRYADPTFAAPGLNAAFEWASSVSNARIATTGTRQYPLYGRDLSNRVQYIGEKRPHGGFIAPTTCPRWRRLLNEGHYDYVVATGDRMEPGRPPYPPTARWTAAPGAHVVLRHPPTVVYKLSTPLDPSSCP
jgi:hypothetical protein